MNLIIDIIIFFLLTIPIIWILTINLNISILFLGLCFLKILLNIFNKKKIIKKTWINWFEISKLIGGIIAIFLITYCRYNQIILYFIITIVLIINIFEAIIYDILNYNYYNAFTGLLLVLNLLFLKVPLSNIIITNTLFLFHIPIYWIIFYTTWNAAFSYGFNYSLSTRLILISSFIVSFYILNNPSTWLGARTYGLILNMILRYFRITYLYKSGFSIITTKKNKYNKKIKNIWGFTNCILLIIYLIRNNIII